MTHQSVPPRNGSPNGSSSVQAASLRRRLHICDLTTLYVDGDGGGGVNTYLTEKARYFADQPDIEHTIVVPGRADETGTLYGSRFVRLRSLQLPWNKDHRVLLRLRTVRRLLRSLRPDLVEVDCVSPLGRSVARAIPGTPILGTYHVHLPEFIARPSVAGFGQWVAAAMEKLTWQFVRYCSRPCDRILVTSGDMLRRIAGELDGLEHIPLGVNTELFRPRSGSVAGSLEEPHVLLYVGRLSPEKQLDVLVQAFKVLQADRSDTARYQLQIVGDGPEMRRLKRLAEGLDVRFFGARPYGSELAELYAGANVFVNPSPYEAFGLANLEAAASGLPVVAISQGGPVDVVTPEIGLLAKPSDPTDLAARIRQALDRPEHFAEGRGRIEREFSWRRCFDHLLEIYRDATQRSSTLLPTQNGHTRATANGDVAPPDLHHALRRVP